MKENIQGLQNLLRISKTLFFNGESKLEFSVSTVQRLNKECLQPSLMFTLRLFSTQMDDHLGTAGTVNYLRRVVKVISA